MSPISGSDHRHLLNSPGATRRARPPATPDARAPGARLARRARAVLRRGNPRARLRHRGHLPARAADDPARAARRGVLRPQLPAVPRVAARPPAIRADDPRVAGARQHPLPGQDHRHRDDDRHARRVGRVLRAPARAPGGASPRSASGSRSGCTGCRRATGSKQGSVPSQAPALLAIGEYMSSTCMRAACRRSETTPSSRCMIL